MKNEDLYSGLTFNEKCQMDVMRIQELEWLTEEEFQHNIKTKYGDGLQATMKLATGDTGNFDGEEYLSPLTPKDLLEEEKVSIFDNLISIDEDDNNEIILNYYE